MAKVCEKCNKEMRGFGTVCAECRKSKVTPSASSPTSASGDKCGACGKVAYAMERISVEGSIFHPTCFKCAHCNNKLSPSAFSKSRDGRFFCKTHYQQLFKVKGRYSFSVPADGSLQDEIERDKNTALADCSAELEQKRRVEELAKAEEDASVEREKAKEIAKRAAEEEQARRVSEIKAADMAVQRQRTMSQEEAIKAIDAEQEQRISEHGMKPRKSLGSISVDELQSKAEELSPTSCKQAPVAAA